LPKRRVLIACEFSGIVREAFKDAGWNAWSCDILDTEQPGKHLKCDVRDILGWNWDLLIAFPPCTHLAVSGARHFEAKRADGRQQEAVAFVQTLWNAPVERIAIENPVGILSTEIGCLGILLRRKRACG
jgi:site-specific DNA-cytosine methylase